jgi:rhodanese-related sulfurtransferase
MYALPPCYKPYSIKIKTEIMFGLEKLFGSKQEDFKQLVAEGATILDVRSPAEFSDGHIPGAINIPVDQLQGALGRFKNKTVITCCRSGARSDTAARMLNAAGIKAINGGAWHSLYKKIA